MESLTDRSFSAFRGRRDYALEDMDVRYQSMYSSKHNGDNMPSPQYEQLKVIRWQVCKMSNTSCNTTSGMAAIDKFFLT